MDQIKAKELVAATGKMLLEQGLVARTWGNVSCRIDDKTFAITPSGLDYVTMTSEDIAVINMENQEWQGKRKPSGERGVHTVAYQAFPQTGFVIHTHQTYATAIGLAGFETLKLSAEEEKFLGKVALAAYGLPGTKKLKNNVNTALKTGAHVILMAHHGALICGANREDAMKKAVLLEEICKKSLVGQPDVDTGNTKEPIDSNKAEIQKQIRGLAMNSEHVEQVRKLVSQQYPNCEFHQSEAVMRIIAMKKSIPAQVDDMAQMIGTKVPYVKQDGNSILQALGKSDAILVEGIGAIVKAADKEDREALKLLVEKAAICYLHTMALHKNAKLSGFDTRLMRFIYQKKYSKQKQ